MCERKQSVSASISWLATIVLAALSLQSPCSLAQLTPNNGQVSPNVSPFPPNNAQAPAAGDRARAPRSREARGQAQAPQTQPAPNNQPAPNTSPPQTPFNPSAQQPISSPPQAPQANPPQDATGAPLPSASNDAMAGQKLGDGELECTVGTKPSSTNWMAPLCEWVGDRPCAGCGAKCVINRGVMSIGFEVLGSTLERRDVMSAIIMCPALSLIARYGEGATRRDADMSCPTEGEVASMPGSLTMKTPLQILSRWPHISKRIHDLVNAKAVGAYLRDNCRQESLTFQPMIQVFSGMWGVTPQQTANNTSPICGDLAGNWLQMYVAETQCIASPSSRDDVRPCLGDDSKWLDTKCVFYYLDIALGRTRESVKAEQYGPKYIQALRSLSSLCTQRTTKADCESEAKDRQTGKVFDTLVGPKNMRLLLWNAMAAATPSYGTPDDNLIKEGEPNPLQVWLSAAPGAVTMAAQVSLLAALAVAALAW